MSIEITRKNTINAIALGMAFGFGIFAMQEIVIAIKSAFREPINYASLCKEVETGK